MELFENKMKRKILYRNLFSISMTAIVLALTGCSTTPCSSALEDLELYGLIKQALMDDIFWGRNWSTRGISTSAAFIAAECFLTRQEPIIFDVVVSEHQQRMLASNSALDLCYAFDLTNRKLVNSTPCFSASDYSLRALTVEISLCDMMWKNYIDEGFSPNRLSCIQRQLTSYLSWDKKNARGIHQPNDSGLRRNASRFLIGPESYVRKSAYVLDLTAKRILVFPNIDSTNPDYGAYLWVKDHSIPLSTNFNDYCDESRENDIRERERLDVEIAKAIACKIFVFGKEIPIGELLD